jgi:hypothetical protein
VGKWGEIAGYKLRRLFNLGRFVMGRLRRQRLIAAGGRSISTSIDLGMIGIAEGTCTMLANRITGLFAVDNPLDVSSATNNQFSAFVNVRQASPAMAATTDIYQAAHAQAVRDFEMNRLFNPEYYGTESEDFQI